MVIRLFKSVGVMGRACVATRQAGGDLEKAKKMLYSPRQQSLLTEMGVPGTHRKRPAASGPGRKAGAVRGQQLGLFGGEGSIKISPKTYLGVDAKGRKHWLKYPETPEPKEKKPEPKKKGKEVK